MFHIRKYLKRFFEWDYALTLLTLVIIFIVPLLSQEYVSIVSKIVFTIIYLLAALTVLTYSKKFLYVSVGLIALEWISDILQLEILNMITNLFSIIFFILIVLIFVARIAQAKEVHIKVILKGINGYLLLILMFSVLANILIHSVPESFSYSLAVENSYGFSDILYYTVVTITTLGYGDFLPATALAKSLSALIAVTGQLYIAILVAMLVGKYIAQQHPKW